MAGQTQRPGYGRELSQQEQSVLTRLHETSTELNTQIQQVRGLPGVDSKWLAIAEQQLQLGFMAAYRAVERPTTF